MPNVKTGLIRSFLLGRGPQSISDAARVITPGGGAMMADYGIAPAKTLTDSLRNTARSALSLRGLKNFAVGERPLDVLHQRMRQGGLVGRGGIVHGALSDPLDMLRSIKEHGIVKTVARNPVGTLFAGMIGHAMLQPLASGVADAVRERSTDPLIEGGARSLARTVASPFGMFAAQPVENLVTNLGGSAAQHLRDVVIPEGVHSLKERLQMAAPLTNPITHESLYSS